MPESVFLVDSAACMLRTMLPPVTKPRPPPQANGCTFLCIHIIFPCIKPLYVLLQRLGVTRPAIAQPPEYSLWRRLCLGSLPLTDAKSL